MHYAAVRNFHPAARQARRKSKRKSGLISFARQELLMLDPQRDTTTPLLNQAADSRFASCIVVDRAGPKGGKQPENADKQVQYLVGQANIDDAADKEAARNLQLVVVLERQSDANEWASRAEGKPVPYVHLWSHTMRTHMAPYIDYTADPPLLPDSNAVFGKTIVWHLDDLMPVDEVQGAAAGQEAQAAEHPVQPVVPVPARRKRQKRK